MADMEHREEIPRRKLADSIVERLLSEIRSGVYPPDSKLPSERALTDRFGVGRSAIREALQTLQRMGVITIAHGERASVAKPTARTVIDQIGVTAQHVLVTSPQTLEDLKQARLFFEVGMVEMAARNATAADIERLDAAIDDQAAHLDDVEMFLAKDMIFHRTIAAMSGNPIYVAVSQAMLEWLSKFYRDLVRAPGVEHLTISEHREICKAIRKHDPKRAAKAMTAHLNRANKLYAQIGATPVKKRK